MATSSITKKFVLKSDEACEKMLRVLEAPVVELKKPSYSCERGKEALKKYFPQSKN